MDFVQLHITGPDTKIPEGNWFVTIGKHEIRAEVSTSTRLFIHFGRNRTLKGSVIIPTPKTAKELWEQLEILRSRKAFRDKAEAIVISLIGMIKG